MQSEVWYIVEWKSICYAPGVSGMSEGPLYIIVQVIRMYVEKKGE